MTDTPSTPDTPVPIDDPPKTLSALNAKVDQMIINGTATVKGLRKLIDSNRSWRRVAVFFVAISLVASITAFNASQDANRTATQVCLGDNRQDAKQQQLWEFIITLTADNPSPLTPEVKTQQTAAFRKFIRDTFKAQEC